MKKPVWIWGLPLSPLTMSETREAAARLVEAGRPSYLVTANVQQAMLTERHAELRDFNANAAFLVADGAPLVWASRLKRGGALPERVAGSDLLFELSAQAARLGHRIFLLGGGPGVAHEAAKRLEGKYPGLQIVGVESPSISSAADQAEAELAARIRAAAADILFVALGSPKGERWMTRNLPHLKVPLCIQIGASLDFAAGRVRRAPAWIRQIGMEWAFRAAVEPRRLLPRYSANAWFILRMVARDFVRFGRRPDPREDARQPGALDPREAPAA